MPACGELAEPGAVAAVEQDRRVALLEPQHVDQMVGVRRVPSSTVAPGGERRVDEDARKATCSRGALRSAEWRRDKPAHYRTRKPAHAKSRRRSAAPSPTRSAATGSTASRPDWLKPYARLARWDRPIGFWLLFWPCGFALALAAVADPARGFNWLALVLMFVGAIAMRGAGCTLNDIVDADLDAQGDAHAVAADPVGRR